MPLHDWAALPGWDGVRRLWTVELLYAIKLLLPPAYRVFIAATPTFAIGGPHDGRPGVGVRDWPAAETMTVAEVGLEPDEEIAVATLAADTALLVEREDRLVAAVELISPRNKDRHAAQAAYGATYTGYLLRGVHLLLVDVHRRPAGFSFADQISTALELRRPLMPAPFAIGYRVGGPSPDGGKFVGVWRRPLQIGAPLPVMQLPLTVDQSVPIDLEATYRRAAAAAYLD